MKLGIISLFHDNNYAVMARPFDSPKSCDWPVVARRPRIEDSVLPLLFLGAPAFLIITADAKQSISPVPSDEKSLGYKGNVWRIWWGDAKCSQRRGQHFPSISNRAVFYNEMCSHRLNQWLSFVVFVSCCCGRKDQKKGQGSTAAALSISPRIIDNEPLACTRILVLFLLFLFKLYCISIVVESSPETVFPFFISPLDVGVRRLEESDVS